MSFSIRFVPPEDLHWESDLDVRYGELRVNDFEEHFQVELSLWTEQDYKRQWHEALTLLVAGANSSCLISSVSDPADSPVMFWWLLYRHGDEVKVQQAISFLDEMKESFDLRNPYAYIPPRRVINEDGERISEWAMTLEDVRAFLDSK